MAKMADLHAQQEEEHICPWCQDTIINCDDAQECPGWMER